MENKKLINLITVLDKEGYEVKEIREATQYGPYESRDSVIVLSPKKEN